MIIVILGPTGVGKTKLSIELAKKLNGEVINADSTQIYKGLDIATAKVKDKENVVHHLFDLKDIKDDYTVFDYQRDARNKIDEILRKNKTPILVGGTGLYIKACLYDYNFPKETKKIDLSNLSNQELYNKVIKVDPNSNIHANNRKRLERSLNYYLVNHKPLSEKEKTTKLLYNAIFIGLTTDRKKLYQIIDKRVDLMVDEGLIEEARTIYNSNIHSKAVMTPIGYKELFPYFENQKSLQECLDLIKQNSRRYAKRQYTFFNNQLDVKWFEVNYDNFNETVKEVIKYIQNIS